jgi:hypothetical protein
MLELEKALDDFRFDVNEPQLLVLFADKLEIYLVFEHPKERLNLDDTL